MSDFWSAWIIVLTAISYVLLAWILLGNRKISRNGDDTTTGHVYDGIEEYDNPMPAWWVKLFVLTMIFGLLYLLAYPGLGKWPGLLDWSAVAQWELDLEDARQTYDARYAAFLAEDTEALVYNPQAMRMAKRVFANNCSVCHGSDAKGSYGFPDLSDNDWLYGGRPEQIARSIRGGRNGVMPSWLAALGGEGVASMAAYVQALSQGRGEAGEHTESRQRYGMFCAACHGVQGEGNLSLGAPSLNDNIWLYGGDVGSIMQTLTKGRAGKMPAHAEMLSDAKIHLLSAYVYQLSRQESE